MSRQSAALSSATQHAMPPEFGRKWESECLNTRFPLPTAIFFVSNTKIHINYITFKIKDITIKYIYEIKKLHYKFIELPVMRTKIVEEKQSIYSTSSLFFTL